MVASKYKKSTLINITQQKVGKVGRIASEEVIIHLILNKCMPILMYDLEAWSI